MKCGGGGVLFPSLPLCRRVHLTVGLFLTGGSEEFQLPAKLTPLCRRARLGPLVGLLETPKNVNSRPYLVPTSEEGG